MDNDDPPCTIWSKRVLKKSDCLAREVNGETVLLNLADETYYALDDVATIMWQAMLVSPDLESTTQSLLQEFDVEPAVLRTDLSTLVQNLLDHSIISLSDPA